MESHPEGAANHGNRLGSCRSGSEYFSRHVFLCGPPRRALKGASLIELLSVAAVLVLLAALWFSALSSFSSSAGRRGAVNILLNAF